MLDFLFITSPTNARSPHPPYYFLALAAYLRERGRKVRIIDVKGGDKPGDLKRHLDQIGRLYEPSRFVGLAAFHSDYPMIMELGRTVKGLQPDTHLLVGNVHSTIDPQDFIFPRSPFDIAVLGEGEKTCYELYSGRETVPIETIQGIAYWSTTEDRIIKTESRPFMDLAELPMPAYDLINLNYYLRPQKSIIRRIYTSSVAVFAGRSCPFDCSFCAANAVWKANTGKAARLRPVREVLEEIAYLKDCYDIDFFYLFDDMFGMSKKWMQEWFKEKMEWSRIAPIPYAVQTRADIATEEMIRALKESGCIQLDVGVETGVQRLLDGVNKRITLEQIRQVFAWAKKYGMRSFATMLLNLPGETEQDLQETYKFLEEIKPSAGSIFSVTTPYPGTKIYGDHCHPRLSKDELHTLINNRLDPQERFRLSEHKIDLEALSEKWNRHFLANPMFERMWCLAPFQSTYWKTVLGSSRFTAYLRAWAIDLPKTFTLWWTHKLGLYRWLKGIQYRGKKK